jgi:hypothetical protein
MDRLSEEIIRKWLVENVDERVVPGDEGNGDALLFNLITLLETGEADDLYEYKPEQNRRINDLKMTYLEYPFFVQDLHFSEWWKGEFLFVVPGSSWKYNHIQRKGNNFLISAHPGGVKTKVVTREVPFHEKAQLVKNTYD